MPVFFRGRVKFFDTEKKYGFIIPNLKTEPEILLLEKNYSYPKELSGELVLPPKENDLHYKIPVERKILIYQIVQEQKGPVALPWTFAEYWDKELLALVKRNLPAVQYLRVISKESRRKPTVLWKGFCDEYEKLFEKGFPKEFTGELHTQVITEAGWLDLKG